MPISNTTDFHYPILGYLPVNYGFALILLLLLLISSVCNPIVFWYHRNIKQTIPAVLYQVLTVLDFTTCLLTVPLFLVTLFPDFDPWMYKETTLAQSIFSSVKLIVTCSANSVTTMLGIVRALVVNRPFVKIKHRNIVLGMGFLIAISAALALYRVICCSHYWMPDVQLTVNFYLSEKFSPCHPSLILILAKYYINAVVAIVAAAMCFYGLHKSYLEKTRNGIPLGNECHGVRTIVMLNALVVMQCIFMTICLIIPFIIAPCTTTARLTAFLALPFSNVVLSALNPLITFIRSQQMVTMVRESSGKARTKSVTDNTGLSANM